jgi:hypothetical protein
VPPVTPVTTPVEAPTVATVDELLLHVPPVTEFVSVMEPPHATVELPPIAGSEPEPTVKVMVATPLPQALEAVYDIVVVPGDTAVTTPVEAPIVATPVAELDHVPPPGVPRYVVVAPQARVDAPEIDGVVGVVTTIVYSDMLAPQAPVVE